MPLGQRNDWAAMYIKNAPQYSSHQTDQIQKRYFHLASHQKIVSLPMPTAPIVDYYKNIGQNHDRPQVASPQLLHWYSAHRRRHKSKKPTPTKSMAPYPIQHSRIQRCWPTNRHPSTSSYPSQKRLHWPQRRSAHHPIQHLSGTDSYQTRPLIEHR